MLKKILIWGILTAVVLLSACHYIVVENRDALPDQITGLIDRLYGEAYAETQATTTPVPAKTVATVKPTATKAAKPTPTIQPSATAPGASIQPSATTGATAVIAPPVGTPAPTPFALINGSSGDEVKALQERLRELGFMTSVADGIFGSRTETAVNAVKQYLFDIEHAEALQAVDPTATADPNDTILMDVVDGEEPATAASADPAATVNPTATVKPAGTAESSAQPGASADPSALPEITASPEPTAEPQPVLDGIVDEALYNLILNDFEVFREEAKNGTNSDEVTRIQTRLNVLDYLYAGMDGIFGGNTQQALIAFQKLNDLEQTGVADRQTQLVLFSADAIKSDRPALPYVLKIDVSKQKVYAYSWNVVDGDYTTLVRTMKCSTGLKATPTPIGTFTSVGPVARWGYFPKWEVYAQYLFRIKDGILFHSVLYREADEDTLLGNSLNNLGRRASHGCVRLTVKDAKWIYSNCPAGTTVIVQN